MNELEFQNILKEKGIEVVDFGTNSTERTDYPIYGKAVGEAGASGECDKGILICGTGVGISLAANKVKGIRAVVCSEPYSALLSTVFALPQQLPTDRIHAFYSENQP